MLGPQHIVGKSQKTSKQKQNLSQDYLNKLFLNTNTALF